MKSAKTSKRNNFFVKRHWSFVSLAIVVVTSILSFSSFWVSVSQFEYYELDNACLTTPAPAPPARLVTVWTALRTRLLQSASASSLLFIVYIEIFASIFQKFSIVVTAQQTAHICQTIFNKVLSCILLLYLELKSSTNRPVFAFVLFLYNSVSTGHISHSHICRTTKLLPGCPNICSKLGIRKQFGVFSESLPGHWEWMWWEKWKSEQNMFTVCESWCHWPWSAWPDKI